MKTDDTSGKHLSWKWIPCGGAKEWDSGTGHTDLQYYQLKVYDLGL